MKAFLAIIALTVAVVLSVGGIVVNAEDACNAFKTCDECIAQHPGISCGFCGGPITYYNNSGTNGARCGGYSHTSHSHPAYICPFEFSTDKCLIGYKCDTTNMTCVPTHTPGNGQTHQQCESNCSTVGKTYLCDNETFTCKIAPAGQGTAFDTCEKTCHKATETHPTESHATETHVTSNHTATASPHSHAPSHAPSTTTAPPLYKCDPATVKCVPAKVGTPGAASQMVCEQTCKSHHNHTPTELVGMWRAIPVDNQKTLSRDEYDFDFTTGGKVQYTHSPGKILSGSVTSVSDAVIITFTDGSKMACLYDTAPTMPTTYQMMFACSLKSGTPPASFKDAMSGAAGTRVLLGERCVDSSICKFKLDAGPKPKKQQTRGFFHAMLDKIKEEEQRIASIVQHEAEQQHNNVKASPCAAARNCAECVKMAECGWCSTNTTNQNGTQGPQCGDVKHSNGRFTCNSNWETFCPPVWVCNAQKQTCHAGTPGGQGFPNQRSCTAACHAKPGPPSQLTGKDWRGLVIDRNYPPGVFALTMNASAVVETLPTGAVLKGTVKHYASYIFFDFPKLNGVITCLFSTGQFGPVPAIQTVTYACSAPNGKAPTGFDKPMAGGKSKESEAIFAHCLSGDCKW